MPRVYVALDLETTGARPDRDEIVEIAAVKFRGDRVLDSWHALVRPTRPLPHQVRRLTGITAEDLAAAPPLAALKRSLLAFLGDAPLVGHSVGNDIAFLRQAGLPVAGEAYDTFELASLLLPDLPEYSLVAVAAHLGVPHPTSHRALPDAEASMAVFLELCRVAEALDPYILGEITRLLEPFPGPVQQFFRERERARQRDHLSASIGARLASRGGVEEINIDFLLQGLRREEPLRPLERPTPIDIAQLTEALAPGGALARQLPGFEQRDEQIVMMRSVAEAFNRSEHLIVEAGTGTGKSVAYLLPALAYAVRNETRVVVSTNTLNLQDQLVHKDLPDVLRALETSGLTGGQTPRTAVLKGRTNYLCLRRLGDLRKATPTNWEEAKVLVRALIWLPRTATGDREELNLEASEAAVWSRISAQADNCLGSSCAHLRKGTCFLYRARREAERAHLVVVNHALLMSDLLVENQLIPEYQHLVIDEAHHLEEVATNQLGFHLGARDLAHFLDTLWRRLDGERGSGLFAGFANHFRGSEVPAVRQREISTLVTESQPLVETARQVGAELFRQAARYLREQGHGGEYERRLRLTDRERDQAGWRRVAAAYAPLDEALQTVLDRIARVRQAILPFDGHQLADYDNLIAGLSAAEFAGYTLQTNLRDFFTAPNDGRVFWLAGSGEQVTLHAAPAHVGPELEDRLFASKQAVILTSATLATGGEDFRYFRERIGLRQARELQLGSPYDYARSTLLAVPTDLPEPNRPDYARRLEEALLTICRAAQGRTLALFTSYAALRQADRGIRTALEREDILVLAHGQDGSRKQLLRAFRSNPRAVLLGTLSFWEGIDIAGDALSVVVITKLPFGVPTDPIFAARAEQIPNAFHNYAVPQSVLRFRQGFGRLIRGRSDRGVVVILDNRVLTKDYGAAFLRALPNCAQWRGALEKLAPAITAWLAPPGS